MVMADADEEDCDDVAEDDGATTTSMSLAESSSDRALFAWNNGSCASLVDCSKLMIIKLKAI